MELRDHPTLTAPETVPAKPAGAGVVRGLIVASRPAQWVKNLLVVAAPAAAGVLSRPELPGRVAVTFACFCALSSASYLFNDIHDLGEDRLHPRKRRRPLASGQVAVWQAG